MGWIHAYDPDNDPHGDRAPGSYSVMDDPMYAAKSNLAQIYRWAAKSLFSRCGIIPPGDVDHNKIWRNTWWIVFRYSMPMAKDLAAAMKKFPLTEEEKVALEWILPRLEKLQQRKAEAEKMTTPEEIRVVVQEFRTIHAEGETEEQKLFETYRLVGDKEVVLHWRSLVTKPQDAVWRVRPDGTLVEFSGEVQVIGTETKALKVKFSKGRKGMEAFIGKATLLPQRPWQPMVDREYTVAPVRNIDQYGRVWLVREVK